jgi:branched-chain amino acid transport system ATP-binding protein
MTQPVQPPFLSVTNLQVAYGQALALHGVSLEVRQGEIVTVLGANGAGKTTLMKAIAGLLPARGGDVQLDGEGLEGIGPEKRIGMGIALVPEGRMIFAPLTVLENLRLGMWSAGWLGQLQLFQERLERVVDLFPILGDRLKTPAGDLSGGQQQMLAVGRALMSKPKLLLLDEPSLGLAPRVIEDIFQTVMRLSENEGMTALFAEQNIDNALAIADRAYVLEVGEVAVSGNAEDLLHRGDIEAAYLGRRSAAGFEQVRT